MYEHTGALVSVESTQKGGYILEYSNDVTNGMSGALVHVVDERLVESHRKGNKLNKNLNKFTIGVHTGSDIEKGVNFGTLITPEINEWVHEMLG